GAGIMPAIDQTMRGMFLRIVDKAPGVGVLASFCRIPGIRPCRPGAMMRLEAQSIISISFGHPQESLGERVGGGYSAGHHGRLPYPIKCLEPLLRLAAALGKLM